MKPRDDYQKVSVFRAELAPNPVPRICPRKLHAIEIDSIQDNLSFLTRRSLDFDQVIRCVLRNGDDAVTEPGAKLIEPHVPLFVYASVIIRIMPRNDSQPSLRERACK